MVAVNPPGRFWWDGAILEDQILRYSALCAEDAYCSSRTSDLAASICPLGTAWIPARIVSAM